MITDPIRSEYDRRKWGLVNRGLFGIALGIFIGARPLASVAGLALVVAVWALIDGIVSIVHAFDVRGIVRHWWARLLGGVVSLLFGIAALYGYPGLSLTFVVLWTAFWLVATGAIAIYVAVAERRVGLPWRWTLAFGLIAVLVGVFAAVFPGITLLGLMGGIAAFGIAGGIALLVGAGKMQFFERDAIRAMHADAPRPRSTH